MTCTGVYTPQARDDITSQLALQCYDRPEDKSETARRMQRILKELLGWWAMLGERCGNWAVTINEQRAGLEAIVEDSPSLKAQLGEILA